MRIASGTGNLNRHQFKNDDQGRVVGTVLNGPMSKCESSAPQVIQIGLHPPREGKRVCMTI
jgi:hypothetical protein